MNIRVIATAVFLQLVSKFPYMFSTRLKDKFRKLDSEVGRWNEPRMPASAGVFENGTVWVTTDVTVRINGKESSAIRKWLHGRDLRGGSRPPAAIDNFSAPGRSSHSGWIPINSDNRTGHRRLDVVSDVNSGLHVSIMHMSAGVCYVTLNFEVSESARESLKGISTSELRARYVFESLNPFKRFQLYTIHSPSSQCDDILIRRVKRIVLETKQTALAILNECGVGKTAPECITVANAFCPDEVPWFEHESRAEDCVRLDLGDKKPAQGVLPYYSLLSRHNFGGLQQRIGSNRFECFAKDHTSQQLSLDALYMVSQEPASRNELGYSADSLSSPVHLSMLIETRQRHQHITQQITPYLLSVKINKKTMRSLYKGSMDIDRLNEELDAIKRGWYFVDNRHHSHANSEIAAQRSENLLVREAIEKRRSLLTSEIEYKNLNWTRRYSKVVFFFVLVQIGISVAVLDWTGEGLKTNIAYRNWVALKSWAFVN